MLRNFAGVSAHRATFSNVPPCEVAARALFGEIDIKVASAGFRFPTTKYGDGIGVGPRAPAGRRVVAVMNTGRTTYYQTHQSDFLEGLKTFPGIPSIALGT